MIDVRSTCIIGFAILDSRNYTAHAIRTLITKTCDTHGLPRRGFYFEGGIWEKSKLLKGDVKASFDDLTWAESELGLRDLGLEFVHSRNPRSKPVERVIGELQNLLDGQPGDAGRNEMTDGFERLEWRKREVESGRAPASQYFLSADEWTARIEHFSEAYNSARRDGEMTRGLTPQQAWNSFQTSPLVLLPAKARYLLSHHRRPVTVGRNGIGLRFGKQTFVYRNERTGALRGQKVLAWFNPELPDFLAVTDMNRENCFTVERSKSVPAMDATDDVLNREMGFVAAHNSYARQRYRILAPLANLNPRLNVIDRGTANLGGAIIAQQQQVLGERNARKKRNAEGAKAFSRLGYQPRSDETVTDRQLGAANELTKLLQDKNL